ncbi:MAG: hypothetical protein IJG53_00145, partial [Eggerthellaceae bacterium]|nr:hypothetical protein [Eggerthellaceae bacterium]
DRVEAVYDDLSLRISPAAWEELLADDVVRGLDTRPEAEEALLRFFMNSYYLPQAIWQLLGAHFDWEARAAELKERFPDDFITYAVLGGIRNGERLPLALFEPGLDGAAADRYINLYNKANNGDSEESAQAVQDMMASPERHPYGDFFLLQAALSKCPPKADEAEEHDEAGATGEASEATETPEAPAAENDPEELLAIMQKILDKHPQDAHLLSEMALARLNREEFEEAEALAKEASEADPASIRPLRILAEARARQGRFSDAIDVIHDMMGLVDGNQSQLYQLNEIRKRWNESLIAQYEARFAEDPTDMQNRFDLAWCYLQNNRSDEAYQMAEPIPEGFPDAFGYHNLRSSLYVERNEYAAALPHEDALIEVIRHMEPDGTDKTQKRMARLSEMMARRAGTLHELGREAEAAKAMEEAVALDPNDTEIITYCAKINYSAKEYTRTLELADRLVELVPYSYHGYLLQAMANYQLHNDGAAYEAVNNAIDADPSDLMEYHIKLLLLARNDLKEEARALTDYLKSEGFGDDLTVQYGEAQLVEDPEGEVPVNRLAAYRALADKLEARPAGDLPLWTADFYHDLAELMADEKDSREDYSRDDLLACLDKGLAFDPDHHDCLSYKAWLLKKEERNEEAIEIFERLAAEPHRGVFPEKHLAELYYRDLRHKAPEALKYYEKVLAYDEEDGDLDFYAGMCRYRMLQLPQAEEHFLAEQRKAPDDIDGFYRLAYVYLMMGRMDDALVQADKTIELAKEQAKEEPGKDRTKFWHPKVTILRRLGRPNEAVAVLRECRQYNPDNTCYKSMFETYMQFGMFDAAEALIKEWKHDKQGKQEVPAYSYAEILLAIMRRKFAKARQIVLKFEDPLGDYFAKHSSNPSQRAYPTLNIDDKTWAKTILDTQAGKTKAAVKHAQELVDAVRKEDGLNSYHLGKYSLALWADGQLEEARKVAQEELKELDERVNEYTSFRPLYLTRRVQALAVLGRLDEAQTDLNTARALPLCEDCPFPRCKDADVFECRLHAMAGYPREALALTRQLMQVWPGEEELVYIEAMLAAKGVR